jgi:quercetin dioxygenase-like cupin family protein
MNSGTNRKVVVSTLSTAMLSTVALSLLAFAATAGEIAPARVTADEIPWPETSAKVEGTGMRAGQQVLIVAGDGKKPGLFTIMFKIPANAKVPPHSHPDERSCFVLSGTFYFAYGATADESLLKALPAGSHYTEPAGMNHFAATRDEPAIAQCTAVGPTGTTFVNPADDPRRN